MVRGTFLLFFQFVEKGGVVVHVASDGVGLSGTRLNTRGRGGYSLDHCGSLP